MPGRSTASRQFSGGASGESSFGGSPPPLSAHASPQSSPKAVSSIAASSGTSFDRFSATNLYTAASPALIASSGIGVSPINFFSNLLRRLLPSGDEHTRANRLFGSSLGPPPSNVRGACLMFAIKNARTNPHIRNNISNNSISIALAAIVYIQRKKTSLVPR